ncbi:AMP-binding protein [Mesobacterium sp. TK19101]|uniref:AMP-binding protein n=1 Tax=Mesobacterium hydrothermale TaxID=3111907 RepID=A0ABU6HBT5_9RHOB|nr:AMP-binding protein [Mesobacterium sp. TK19101]MEC3859923.1 AMP-binding protein [Mesobacterium sp. TK19101]
MNPAEWLRRTAIRCGQAPALFAGETLRMDYAGFDRAAAGLGAALQARGLGPGARIGIFMKNRVEYLIALYGIWYAGAVAIPINAKLHVAEAAWILDNAEAALCLVSEDVAEGLAERTEVALVSVDDPGFGAMLGAPPMAAPVLRDPGDMVWLFYTSGTTGKPKGVMMTCGNISAMALSYFVDADEVKAGDAILYAAPMSHGAGIYNFMHVMRGARHVVPDSGGFEPAEILELAPKMGPISMFAAPTMVRRLVDVAKARGMTGEGIKTIVYAGGPMYNADIIEAVDVMGPRFVQIYGQGECPMAITALSRHDVADRSHPRWRDRLGSVGVAQSVSHVAIFDEDGAEVPRGETGEIVVRGAAVMAGYWKNDAATAKTVRDGWLWTGDMGRMDEDGYVTMVDRSKDMIISGGSNIYPREVEEVLLEHPAVSEAAVVGRKHPEWGEEVVAFVVGDADRAALDALCLDRIARFKRPKDYVFVDALPKNNYGKVLKTDLRAKLEEE